MTKYYFNDRTKSLYKVVDDKLFVLIEGNDWHSLGPIAGPLTSYGPFYLVDELTFKHSYFAKKQFYLEILND